MSMRTGTMFRGLAKNIMIKIDSQKSNLDTILVNKLIEKFKRNNWEIDDDKTNETSFFNRFCKMLENLGSNQQDLILELTENFLKISTNEYLKHLDDALLKINSTIISSCNPIYVIPLLAPEDIGKPKSSMLTVVLLRDLYFKYHKVFGKKEIKVWLAPDKIPQHVSSSSVVILIDDFIGTGETAESALKYLLEKSFITKDRIIVISIVAQAEGISRIKDLGVNVYATFERKKGISDYYSSPKKEEYTEVMRSIEDLIEPDKDFRFGYKASEALVSMHRTPNNTFPIYWFENKKKNNIAPFPR